MSSGFQVGFRIALLLSVSAGAAQAQVVNTSAFDRQLSDTANSLKAISRSQGAVGYTVAPGIVVTGTVALEAGHDSNPDAVPNGQGAAYGQANGALGVTSIGERSLGQVSVSGTSVGYDGDYNRSDRYLGQVKADYLYTLAPGWAISTGGLYKYSGLRFTEDQFFGGYVELGYNNGDVAGFIRGRGAEVQYLTPASSLPAVPVALLPLFRTSTFDARRYEVSAGYLFNAKSAIAPYVEGAVAQLDYFNEAPKSIIDRDATDAFLKTGIRTTFSPTLQADLGWRWNVRKFGEEPNAGPDFSSSDFDASVRWSPAAYFSLTATVDRTIDEPSVAFSRLADTKSYGLNINYAATDRIGISASGRRRMFEEVGGDAFFRSTEVQGEITYGASRWTQYYAGILYESLEETRSGSEYDRVRVGAGVRMTLGEGMHTASNVFGDGKRDFGRLNYPGGMTIETSTGYSWFRLPDKHMMTHVGGRFFDEALGQAKTGAGDFEGVRTSLTIDNIARHTLENGRSLTFGVGGFYAAYDTTTRSGCDFTATTDCAFVNIVDFDHLNENNTGPFGKLRAEMHRDVRYWGVEPFMQLGHVVGGGLKDAPVSYTSPFIIGGGVRGIQERTHLTAIDVSVPDPVKYKEKLDTFYYGGFVGLRQAYPLGHGISLSFDGRAGVYYASTSYQGSYKAFVPTGTGSDYVLEQGRVALTGGDVSFIGSMNVKVDRDLGWGKIGAFGMVEYLSFVPEVQYNNNDHAGGSPFGIVGTQHGTGYKSSDAWNTTVGLSLAVPLNH